MRIQIDTAEAAEGLWLTELSESDLAVMDLIAKPALVQGDVSVVLLTEPPVVEAGHILVAPSTMKVLNRGSTHRAVLVLSATSTSKNDVSTSPVAARGDSQFVNDLPATLRNLGTQLLAEVRRRWPGALQPTDSGRFVDSPDNFWTVKIQPRDVSLRVTVRGEPKTLRADPVLNLKADRPGYSTFKISEPSQLKPAIDVLVRARRR